MIASQITGVSIVYSTVCSSADQRKHQNSASLAFVRGIHRWPVNSSHKGPVKLKMFPFDDVIMWKSTGLSRITKLTDILSTWAMSPRGENAGNIILTKFWSLAAPKAVIIATSCAAGDENFINMTFPFQRLCGQSHICQDTSPDLNLTPLAAFFYVFCLAALGKKRKKAAKCVRFKSGLVETPVI